MAELSIDGLHPAQKEVYLDPTRFCVVAAGRRWGKTKLGIASAFARAWTGGRVWWIAPNYPVGQIAWREIKRRALDMGLQVSESEKMVSFRGAGGGYLQLKSADNPNSLRGEGLDRAILDEAAFMPEAAWTESLRPALTDRKGDALFLSTTHGRNYFYRLFTEPAADWKSWTYKSVDNPYIDPAEIEAARSSLPLRVFQQEHEAAFVDLAGSVFRHIRDQATAVPQERALEDHTYTFGIDWARSNDFTAVTVIDVTLMAVVKIDRWTGVEYEPQMGRVTALFEAFRPQAIVSEVNNMGGPLFEALRDRGLPIVPFVTTNATKLQLVDSLSLSLERQTVTLVADEYYISELESYEGEQLKSGLMRYSAPSGLHDDLVMSTMLAHWGASNCDMDFTAQLM